MATVQDFFNASQAAGAGSTPAELLNFRLFGGRSNAERLADWGITDPFNNLSAAVPDPIKGSLIPSGNDLGGFMLALAPLALMTGGFAGVGGLSNAAGTGLSGLGAADAAWGANALADAGGMSAADAAMAGIGNAWEGAAGASAAQNAALAEMGAGGALANTAAAAGGGGTTLGGLLTPGGGLFGLSPLQTMMGANLLGSGLQTIGGLVGANTQANAAQRATDATLGMFNTINAQGAPYRAAGYGALNTIAENQPYFNRQFTNADLNANMAPNYAWSLDQGLRATKNAANAQTGLLSGNTLKGVADYVYNKSQDAYQNAFSNFENQRQGIYNRLASIAGLGQTGGISPTAGAASSMTQPLASSIQNYGTALGGGFVGAGNALAGGLNNAASWYTLPSILSMGRA